MQRDSRQERWTVSRHPGGKCSGCKYDIAKGVPVYYIPKSKKIYCQECAKKKGK